MSAAPKLTPREQLKEQERRLIHEAEALEKHYEALAKHGELTDAARALLDRHLETMKLLTDTYHRERKRLLGDEE